jgi:ubiquinone biosynthesis protein
MAHLLSYLFEVTERFGMETRTELILLQRTMVVVEGVARTMHPQINIWQVAQPVVEQYIRDNVGPSALLRDMFATARVMGRFGPKMPKLVEAALTRQMMYSEPDEPSSRSKSYRLVYFVAGVVLSAAAAVLIGNS